MDFFLYSSLLGLVAGFLAGLFGIGGGLIIVPVLVWLFGRQQIAQELIMIMALATSLATIVFTAISSAYAHHRQGTILWATVFRLTPGIIFGAGFGALIADYIDKDKLRLIFIAYLLYVGVQMALQIKPSSGNSKTSKLLDYLAGLVIGIMSSLVGIGGGTLTVPYLVHCQVPMKNAVAVASACGFPIALAGTLSYILLGLQQTNLPLYSLGYVYLPAFCGVVVFSMFTAPLGAKLANKLPAAHLKRYFSMVIFITAAKMLWT